MEIFVRSGLDRKEGLSIKEAEEVLKKIETYPNYNGYVAEQDGEIVGVFELLIMDNLGHKGRKSAIIEDIAVDPGYQGQGIGKAMMLFAMDLAREEQCYKIVISSNIKRVNAHKFYEKLGFRIHGYSFFVDS